jgi:hypothetical protein
MPQRHRDTEKAEGRRQNAEGRAGKEMQNFYSSEKPVRARLFSACCLFANCFCFLCVSVPLWQISVSYARQNHSLRKADLNEVSRDGQAAP